MAEAGRGDKFKLYWLNDSRAHRILWLLELLQLDYTVEIHLRDVGTWRCTSLYETHFLGKAPILEVVFADGLEPLTLVESGHIIQFLLKNYDPHQVLTPIDRRQQIEVDYYLHYSEGTLQPMFIALLINGSAKNIAPVGLKSISKFVTRAINNGYYIHEWRLNMQYLENRLKKEGHGFFVGDKLTGADVILSFPLFENVFDNVSQIKEVTGEKRDLKKLYPNLAAWCDRVKNHPLYAKIDDLVDTAIQEKLGA